MKKYKVVTRKGLLNYYTGEKCAYVIAAVSIVPPSESEQGFDMIHTCTSIELDGNEGTIVSASPIAKQLRLGISLCVPSDMAHYDEQFGITKAVGKALSNTPAAVITSSIPGLIGTAEVESILSKVENQFTTNPEMFLAGYVDSKRRYEHDKALKEVASTLTEEEQAFLNVMKANKDNPDRLKNLILLTKEPGLLESAK